jgi:hypothetical protein
MIAAVALALLITGCGSARTLTTVITAPAKATTAAQTASQSSSSTYTDCVDNGSCPLTIARARVAAVTFAAQVVSGEPFVMTGCE